MIADEDEIENDEEVEDEDLEADEDDEEVALAATDDEDDEDESSLEELLAQRAAARRGTDDSEDDDILSLTSEPETIPPIEPIPARVIPLKDRQEFVCNRCHLVKARVQLADAERGLCRDCV
ncbi:MAG: DUF4193 family protein [Actinomycetota bacterium]|nr:DUF4193 family protein [Actinomycetota bacterium]